MFFPQFEMHVAPSLDQEDFDDEGTNFQEHKGARSAIDQRPNPPPPFPSNPNQQRNHSHIAHVHGVTAAMAALPGPTTHVHIVHMWDRHAHNQGCSGEGANPCSQGCNYHNRHALPTCTQSVHVLLGRAG